MNLYISPREIKYIPLVLKYISLVLKYAKIRSGKYKKLTIILC